MSNVRSEFYTIKDKDGRDVCRACGREHPHRYEHVMFTRGAVRCVAVPLDDHNPGPDFVRGKIKSVADTWEPEWLREIQNTGAVVQYIGGWAYEAANGALHLPEDVHPMTRSRARAARKGFGYAPNHEPVGQHTALRVERDEDGWFSKGDPDRGQRLNARVSLPADLPVYDTEGDAIADAKRRWTNKPKG